MALGWAPWAGGPNKPLSPTQGSQGPPCPQNTGLRQSLPASGEAFTGVSPELLGFPVESPCAYDHSSLRHTQHLLSLCHLA